MDDYQDRRITLTIDGAEVTLRFAMSPINVHQMLTMSQKPLDEAMYRRLYAMFSICSAKDVQLSDGSYAWVWDGERDLVNTPSCWLDKVAQACLWLEVGYLPEEYS